MRNHSIRVEAGAALRSLNRTVIVLDVEPLRKIFRRTKVWRFHLIWINTPAIP